MFSIACLTNANTELGDTLVESAVYIQSSDDELNFDKPTFLNNASFGHQVKKRRMESIVSQSRKQLSFGRPVPGPSKTLEKRKIINVFANPVSRISHGRLVNAPGRFKTLVSNTYIC